MSTLQQAAHALLQQQMQGIREELSMQQERFMEEQRQATQAALQQQLESLAAAGALAATRSFQAGSAGAAVDPPQRGYLKLPKFGAVPSESFASWLSTVMVLTQRMAMEQRVQLIVAALEGLALSKFQIIGEEQLQRDPPQSENDLRLFLARLFSEEETDLQRDQRFARRLKYRGDRHGQVHRRFCSGGGGQPSARTGTPSHSLFFSGTGGSIIYYNHDTDAQAYLDNGTITTGATVCRYGDHGRGLCSQV